MARPQDGAESFWRAVHEAFDPIRPVTDPALRVEREARYNPMVELDRRLRLPIGHMCYGVAGSVGSGKSTELLAAADKLTDDALVVFVDLWRHFESSVRDPGALNHLQPWELIGLLGLSLVRAGTDRFGHKWEGREERLAEALGAFTTADGADPSVDVARLAGGLAVAAGGAVGAIAGTGLQLLKAATDSWTWRIGLRDRKRSSDQEPRVRRVLVATNEVIEALQSAYDRKLVLVVDGLDRVQASETFKDLFVESNLLPELACDTVVCAELGLVQRYRSRLRLSKTFELTNIPVASAGDPWSEGPGIDFFHDVIRRRLASLDVPVPSDAFPSEMVRRIAWCSGGRLRDFMSLVREIAIHGLINGVTTTAPETMEAVIDVFRRECEGGLNAKEIAQLQHVLDDPKHRLPDGDVALTLLDKHLLLAYPNQSTWYLPHPVLMLTLLQRPQAQRG
ncbi:hypothetical protein [Paraliomyxa miuraensis]|uniref:hypothetical protein n=1 Tax=Paraliomyxa miuraensis TaxID=376150 RepID=UPI00224DFC35|nr:hypothetical protein [Paraliomyxa miuraensis]MCX4240295.1 hypothetical protein [Paraliomyxa miuraensis]